LQDAGKIRVSAPYQVPLLAPVRALSVERCSETPPPVR
jgi:hypothetical protein